ncbi:hypothetical protein L9F63_026321, partial [Diploptera punctata]
QSKHVVTKNKFSNILEAWDSSVSEHYHIKLKFLNLVWRPVTAQYWNPGTIGGLGQPVLHKKSYKYEV